MLDAEQEVGRDEHRLNGNADRFLPGSAALPVGGREGRELGDLAVGGRPAVGAPRQSREDPLLAIGRMLATDEDFSQALLGRRNIGIEGPGDLNEIDAKAHVGDARRPRVAGRTPAAFPERVRASTSDSDRRT